jgi:hypothetical protein
MSREELSDSNVDDLFSWLDEVELTALDAHLLGADSTGRRNISLMEVLDGTTTWLDLRADRAGADALAGQTGCQSAGDQKGFLEVHCRGAAE